MNLKQSDYLVIVIVLLAGVWGFGMMSVSGNTESVHPEAYNYWGTVKDHHLMDSSYGYGDFTANTNGYTMFKNSNDPFTKADCAEGYILFELEYADVTSNGKGGTLWLHVYRDSDGRNPYKEYPMYYEDFDGKVHWSIRPTNDKLSDFDTNNDGIIDYVVLKHSDYDTNSMRIYNLKYVISFDELEPDPCDGIICQDKCIGEYWGNEGKCIDGTCYYDKEKIDGLCGYTMPTATPTPTATQTPTSTPTATATYTPTPTATEPNGNDPESNDDILIIGGFMIGIIGVLALAYFVIKTRK